MKNKVALVVQIAVIFGLTFLLVACSTQKNNGAEAVVEQYFQAIVNGDEDRIATLSCADWESSARADVAAFYGVKARLEGVTCTKVETGESAPGDSVVIECGGAIIATYNNEDASFELAGKQFKVIDQGGEWLVCGYVENQ